MLLVLCAIGAFLGWTNPSPVIIISSVIIGFVLALITTFKPQNAQYTATLYAAVEGVALEQLPQQQHTRLLCIEHFEV